MAQRRLAGKMDAVATPVKLIAVDIDGTLLDSRFQAGEADLEALRQARDAGIEIVLCTGRRHTFALPIAKLLGYEVWMCTANGAVTRSTRNETLHVETLGRELALALCAHMERYRGTAVLTFDQETRGALVVERTDELSGSVSRWLEHNAPYIEKVEPLEAALTRDPIQMMFCSTIARMEEAAAELERFPRRSELTVLRTQYDERDLCLLDVLAQDCSKGHALGRLADHLGVAHEAILAIGDNSNDMDMLELAGTPVVMGNATEDLKSRGWHVTASNDEHGIARALHHFLGIQVCGPATPEESRLLSRDR